MRAQNNKQILIIDDAKDIQALLVMLFEGEGYKVDTAANGADALTFLRSTSNLPSLILLDLMMPVMDGFEFRKVQETEPRVSDIPVIVMTADNNIQSLALKTGVQDFLKKPFASPQDVLKTVGKYFND